MNITLKNSKTFIRKSCITLFLIHIEQDPTRKDSITLKKISARRAERKVIGVRAKEMLKKLIQRIRNWHPNRP